MDKSKINDKRLKKDFKGISFSNYKKSDAKKQLLNYLLKHLIDFLSKNIFVMHLQIYFSLIDLTMTHH